MEKVHELSEVKYKQFKTIYIACMEKLWETTQQILAVTPRQWDGLKFYSCWLSLYFLNVLQWMCICYIIKENCFMFSFMLKNV